MTERAREGIGPIKPQTRIDISAHTPGVHEGQEPKKLHHTSGTDMNLGEADARRSTSICPEDREPIDPSMPRLSPP